MLPRLLNPIAHHRSRRFISGVALIAYLVSFWGLPVALPVDRDLSTPYPCQNHHCGCNSAAQCWDNCCCFSPAERLAWAREHHVEIPAAMLAALNEAAKNEVPAKSCCQHRHAEKACQADKACQATGHESSSCESTSCSSHSKSQPQASTAQTAGNKSSQRTRLDWVHGFQAQKCQGLTMLWVSAGITLPHVTGPAWEFDMTLRGVVCQAAPAFPDRNSAPPVRPPRV